LEICEVDVLPEVEPMPEPKSYAKRLVKGSAIVLMAFIASELVGLFLRMFLARSLTVVEYSLFYAVFTLISFFGLFRELGLSSALVKYIPEFVVRKQFAKIKSSIVSALFVQAAFGFIVSAALFVLSDYIALAMFRTLDASLPLKILSVWFFVAIFCSIAESTFNGFQNMPAYASINFFNPLSILLLAVLFVGFFGLGTMGVALAYLIAAAVMGLSSLTFIIRRYPHVFREKASVTKPLLKKLFVFALPILAASIGGLILSYTDTIMITIFRPLPEVGFYQAAQPTARILWYFPIALTVVLFPIISELWARGERKLLGGALHFLTKFSFILIIPAAFIFIAFPEIVINLLYGPGYLAGATALQILGAVAIVYTPFVILAQVMRGMGRPVVLLKIVAFMACFNIVGNLALIPSYGIEGAAVATFVAQLLGLALLFYYARKFVRFTMPSSSLLKTAIGGVLTLLLIFGLKSILALPPWPEAFVVMISGLLFYGAWILATKAITKDDLRLIARIVPMPGWLVRAARRVIG
jgi:O-antigen/teichoic acid export membrane protein